MVNQLSMQQQRRARQLVALVPKPGAKSDEDESESSEDELQCCFRSRYSDSSSPPPSLPSSIENLNLLDDDDNEVNEVVASTSLALYEKSSPSISACSPSILSTSLSVIRQLNCAGPSLLSPEPPTTNILPSEVSPLSPRLSSSQVFSPRASNLTRRNQVPSPLFAPSPSAATRSKKPRVVVIKHKVLPPKRLQPTWRYCKFTGSAEVEDGSFMLREEKSAIEYFKLFFSDDIIIHKRWNKLTYIVHK